MDGDQSIRRGNIPTPSSSDYSINSTLPSDSIIILIDPRAQAALTHDRHASRRQFHSHPHAQPPASSEPISPIQIHTAYLHLHQNTLSNNTHHGLHDAAYDLPVSPITPMTAGTACSKHLLLSDLRPLSNQQTQRPRGYHNSNGDSTETLEPSGSYPFPFQESESQQYSSTLFEEPTSVSSPEPRALCRRYPPTLRGSRYTRFFGLERPTTQSRVVVQSPWLSTGLLFLFRLALFVYSFAVLATDLVKTERLRYSFCHLTQLSYLGLVSYLGVSCSFDGLILLRGGDGV